MASPATRFLIITADPLLGRTLNDGLVARGYLARRATTNGEARVLLEKGPWSAVVLDTSLEDGKGMALLDWVRQRFKGDLPDMMLLGAAGGDPRELEDLARRHHATMVPPSMNTPLDVLLRLEKMVGLGAGVSSRLLARDTPLVVEEGSFAFTAQGQREAVRVLTTLAVARETGTIRRILGDRVHEIRLVQGGMVASNTPDDADLLGAMAVEAGLVQQDRMDALLQDDSPLPLGVRLVREGEVSPPAIRALIRMQVRRRVLSILRQQGGRLEWSPEPMPQGDPLRVVVPAIPVAWEATRSMPPWVPGAVSARPAPGRSVALIAPDLPLREPHRGFLQALDGRCTLAEAAVRVGLGIREALHLCARLDAVGAVTDPDGQTRVPPSSLPVQRARPTSHIDAEKRIYEAVRGKRWDEAVRACERLLEAGATSPRVYTWLGLARYRTGAPLERCVPMIHRALALEPGFILAHWVLARILARKDYAEEVAAHQQIAELLNLERQV